MSLKKRFREFAVTNKNRPSKKNYKIYHLNERSIKIMNKNSKFCGVDTITKMSSL